MKIEKLKEKARKHEQREEWREAMDLYTQALDRADDEDDQDIALYNRMGDLRVRVGDVDGAVEAYERAIDLYLDADLANNALAVCRKLERNAPDRPGVLLRMGQIRVRQGFVVDARQDFLDYAERQLARGDSEEALRALEEFASLVPDDADIRLFLAGHLQHADREEDAVEYLSQAFRILVKAGEDERAAEVRERVEELDPEADLDAPVAESPDEVEEEPGEGQPLETMDLGLEGFETTSISGMELDAPEAGEGAEASDAEPVGAEPTDVTGEDAGDEDSVDEDEDSVAEEEDEDPLAALEGAVFDLDDDSEAALEDLPLLEDPPSDEDDATEADSEEPAEFEIASSPPDLPADEGEDRDDEGEDEGMDLPLMDLKGDDEPVPDLPGSESSPSVEELKARIERTPGDGDGWRRLGTFLIDEGQDEHGREALERAHRAYADAGDPEKAMRVLRELIFHDPDRIEYYQRLVEYAHRTRDRALLVPAFLELAEALARTGAQRKAEVVYGRVLALDPRNPRAREALAVGSARRTPEGEDAAGAERRGEFVNLGGMVLDEPGEDSFRWKVSDADPTGDEEADFARMLTQFKEKVARNLPSDDATAHYDLGAAYKDMGLLDEAVGQFQRAIRAQPGHLAAYEMAGQCFLEKDEPEIAVRTLSRALEVDRTVEEDLLGIYYYLGQAHEAVGNSESAREFYERVFSLDINFMDVTERLRALR